MAENIIEKNLETVFDPQRPFLGLRSFEENNKSQYGGRDTEIKEIFTQIKNTGLTVVFGKSGIGKTSLLKAGVIPELQKNLFFPMYVRIDFSSDKNPLFQLKDLVFQKLNEQDGTIPEFGTRTLWEYFHDIKLHNGLMTPVLILDQFEEVFTIGKDKSREVLELIIELADLAENHVPMEVQKRYEDNATIMSAKYGERKYSVVLSLREDYLAQLESYKRYMPSINSSRYRVVQMTAMQALEAATKSSNGLIEKDVAIEIIKKTAGVTDRGFDETAIDPDNETRLKVEPFLLSLICFQVNEKAHRKRPRQNYFRSCISIQCAGRY
ncbi:MAG: ATP-binding protein [Bacteroidetes bacterium]|nr:ATP-binding protein [Bacteroidota bacterium]